MGGADDKDKARKLILARRARFVAVALASVAATTGTALGTEGCKGGGGDIPNDEADSSTTTPPGQPPQACLSVALPPAEGGVPQPCLTAPIDQDAEPQPCLKVAPPVDGGDGG